MSIDDDDTPEWEIPEETPPPHLEKKWNEEDASEDLRRCASCGKFVSANALLCLYCGEKTGLRTGVFGHLKYWLLESWLGLALMFLLLASVFALFVLY